MPTRKLDPVKYSSPDGGKTKYIENQRVADDLKAKGAKAVAGKASGDRSKRMAKNRQFVERKRGSTPTKRTTASGPSQATQPVSRPPSPPPAQTFAQNGMNMPPRPMGQYGPVQGPMGPGGQMPTGYGPPQQPQYNPLPQQPMQPRPSAFGQQQPMQQQPYQQPNSAMTMGIPPNPYGAGWNPVMNPWGRRW